MQGEDNSYARNGGQEENGDENLERNSDDEEPCKPCMSVYRLKN